MTTLNHIIEDPDCADKMVPFINEIFVVLINLVNYYRHVLLFDLL